MIKNFIAPIQTWLLTQKRCVGCGTPLNQAKNKKSNPRKMVVCRCGRIYIFENKGIYRRARFDEV